MTSRSARAIERALLAKGFRYKDSRHRQLELYDGEEPTGILTIVSHSNIDYGDALLAQVSRQLKLSKSELLDLVDCRIDTGQYIALLRERGLLPE